MMVKLMKYLMTGVRVRDQPLGRTNPLQDHFFFFEDLLFSLDIGEIEIGEDDLL